MRKKWKKSCSAALSVAMVTGTCMWSSPQEVQAAEPRYEANWDSLEQVETAPEWFKDAKFGIYFHWGAFTTPEKVDEWYGQKMYNGSGDADWNHREKYGDPKDWPYHNFIVGGTDKQGDHVQFAPKLTAEYEGGSEDGKFDPKAWAQLFKESGAKFAGPVMEHHDGFSMWDSEVTPWNSVDLGPQLDLARIFVDEIRGQDMKVLSAMHHAYNVNGGFYESAWDEKPWENPPEGMTVEDAKKLYGQFDSQEERDTFWLDKLKEIIDKYDPDIIWQDFELNTLSEAARLEFLSYFYNQNIGEDGVVATYKYNHEINDGFTVDSAVPDYERGGPGGMRNFYWLTDDALSQSTWSYTEGMSYYSAKSLIHALIDKVSKNGNLLLNISPRADGSIPQEQQDILLEIGEWLGEYGEAIYETRAWNIYGEGPTMMGGGVYGTPKEGTDQDIRFTRSKDNKTLYAINLGKPEDNAVDIKTLKADVLDADKISGIYMADGSTKTLEYTQDEQGLHITMPENLPETAANAVAVEIVFKDTITDIQGVGFWSDNDYKGTEAVLVSGEYGAEELQEAGISPNSISSVQVPEGYAVYVYTEEGSEWYGIFEKDLSSLGSWNDSINAIKVVKNQKPEKADKPKNGHVYKISLRSNPEYVLEYAGEPGNDANVQIGKRQKNAENQEWRLTQTGEYYKISPAANENVCIDIGGGSYDNGTNLLLWEYGEGADNRQWKFEDTGNGYYSIHSKGDNNYCLDEAENPPAEDANVQLWEYTYGDRQQWKLEDIQEEASTEIQTENLQKAIDMANKLKENQEAFTTESWKRVETALQNAEVVMEKQEVTQEEVDQVFLELITECNLLVTAAQKTGLRATIAGAEEILNDSSQYTEDSVAKVEEALKTAKEVEANPEATQEEINLVSGNLMGAVTSLLAADSHEQKERLEILLAKAEELAKETEKYTQSSLDKLNAAIVAAQGALNGTEEEQKEAYNNLVEAITSLERKANKSELSNAIAKANEILENSSQYVGETLENLEQVRDAAQQIYDEEAADIESITAVLETLIQEILQVRKLGDVDGNGDVNSADAAKVLAYTAEMEELSEEDKQAGDVNLDGASDSADAVEILRYAAESITEF